MKSFFKKKFSTEIFESIYMVLLFKRNFPLLTWKLSLLTLVFCFIADRAVKKEVTEKVKFWLVVNGTKYSNINKASVVKRISITEQNVLAYVFFCIRDQCKSGYGTCDLFTDYTQEVQTLNKINKHSNYDKKEKNEEHMKALDDFLLPGSVCALAAANNSADTLWFVQIKGEFESTTSVSDYYGHIVTPDQNYMLGPF